MPVKLDQSWTARLAKAPETGMGYQVLELRGLGIRSEHVIVANAEDAIEGTSGRLAVREGVEPETRVRIRRLLTGPVTEASYRVLNRREAVAVKARQAREEIGGGPASDTPLTLSKPDERFLRYSAYPNDIRILADGSVRPGTYVTTHADGMMHVKTGADAVRRYALPNPDPAVHRYFLKPPRSIQVRRGTVQPAHGQPGGGVEVIFEVGSPAGTLEKQDEIPPR